MQPSWHTSCVITTVCGTASPDVDTDGGHQSAGDALAAWISITKGELPIERRGTAVASLNQPACPSPATVVSGPSDAITRVPTTHLLMGEREDQNRILEARQK